MWVSTCVGVNQNSLEYQLIRQFRFPAKKWKWGRLRVVASRRDRRSYGSPLCLLTSTGLAGYIKKGISGCQILEHAWLLNWLARKAATTQHTHTHTACKNSSSSASPGKLSRSWLLWVRSSCPDTWYKTLDIDTVTLCHDITQRTQYHTIPITTP